MTKLLIGPPVAPYTVIDEKGLADIENRLGIILDTDGYTDDMAPAVRHIARTLLTQDLPALIQAIKSGSGCEDCASIHRVHHTQTVKIDVVRADTIPMKSEWPRWPIYEKET